MQYVLSWEKKQIRSFVFWENLQRANLLTVLADIYNRTEMAKEKKHVKKQALDNKKSPLVNNNKIMLHPFRYIEICMYRLQDVHLRDNWSDQKVSPHHCWFVSMP